MERERGLHPEGMRAMPVELFFFIQTCIRIPEALNDLLMQTY